MIGIKKNVVVFFGLFLIGMLFVPTGIPFMVPEAEAVSAPYTITDDATGGDCQYIGTWTDGTKTCNVTAGVTGGIIVGSDGITLNGNSNGFSGWSGNDYDCIPKCPYNILVEGKDSITIKNFHQINSAGNNSLRITYSQNVTIINNNNLGALISSSQHVTMTNNVFKPALTIAGPGDNCPSDIEINNNTFEQKSNLTPGILLHNAAYQTNISCVWYNLNAAGNTGVGSVLNFNLNTYTEEMAAADAAAADAAAADAAAQAAADAAADAAAQAAADAAAMAAATDEIVIPDWIRINAGWWADGLIDDRTFVSGLQWLITNGVMVIG